MLKAFVFLFLLFPPSAHCGEEYEESLWVRRLANDAINLQMEFAISSDQLPSNHTALFPRTFAEIITAHHVDELQLSLTQGHWRLGTWGEPFPLQMAPTGAALSASFYTNSSDSRDADAAWRGLTNRLSGLTCASLNFLDETTSIEPKFGQRSHGQRTDGHIHVRAGALPREFLCTENLTPWVKLLPCGNMRGLGSLLRSKTVFNTAYHSAQLAYSQSRPDAKLKASFSLVFDKPKDTDNFVNLMGSLAIFPCHPARKTNLQIWEQGGWKRLKREELNGLKSRKIPQDKEKHLVFSPMVYLGGYGQEYGKIVVEMTNHLKEESLPVLYLQVLPWFIRPYLHTMKIQVNRNGQIAPLPPGSPNFHYAPGRDRKALHKLELQLQLPPDSQLTLSFEVEKSHLKWDEYPPDANHGFYLQAASFQVNTTRQYYSRILLVNLPTPDFSMPYNVICLTCTVIALAFGPLHNISSKRLRLKVFITRGGQFWNMFRGIMNTK